MRKLNGTCIYSPSDLITYLLSEYVSWMDRFHLEFPNTVQPDQDTEEDRILRAKGEEHERVFLKELVCAGHDILDLKGTRDPAATLQAMRDGREVIYQATVALGRFAGVADFLVRVEGSPRWVVITTRYGTPNWPARRSHISSFSYAATLRCL
jgi:predicted RecB family nuclease